MFPPMNQLKAATDRYLIAQSTGDPRWLSALISTNTTYSENLVPTDIHNSTLSQPLRIDYSRTSIDTVQCATYTELLSLSPTLPSQIGIQLRLDPSTNTLTSLTSIITTTGDLFFSPSHTLHYTLLESWTPLPPSLRSPREVLKAAADAYYDVFVNKSVAVPWGTPCTRLEGGNLDANGTCDTGIPNVEVRTTDRRYVIDETLGVVNVISHFGILGPDSHEFRIVDGTIRQIHSITLCRPVFNCGLEMPAVLGEDIGF